MAHTAGSLCPPLSDLHVAADQPSDADGSPLAGHLADCAACREALATIRADNALANELAGAATRPDSFGGDLAPGTRIGRYTIISALGIGGMGVVYEAAQDAPRRAVALKLIKTEFASPALLRRFEHEAAALALLQHPGIAQVFEAGAAEVAGRTRPYIAMELVRGLPLDKFVEQSPLDLPTKLRLLAEIADAVDHAHRRGVIHRDLKPANILISNSPSQREGAGGWVSAPQVPLAIPPGHSGHLSAKILDFGVAKFRDPSNTIDATQPGGFVGTLAYASPEQVGGDPAAIDARSDVYALGLILYRLITGRHPYTLETSLNAAVKTITEARITPPRELGMRLDDDLEIIIRTALARDPARRYLSAAALAEDLRRFLDKRPIRARPDSSLYVLRKSVARHPYRAAAALAFALLAVGATVVAASLRFRAAREEQAKSRVLDAVLSGLERTKQDETDAPRLESIKDFLADARPIVDAQLAEFPEEHALVLWRLGRASLSHHLIDEAADMLQRVVDYRARHAGADPLAYTDALIDLGRARVRRGEFETALGHFTTAHDLRRKSLGEDDRQTIAARYQMGAALHGWKKYDFSVQHFRAAAAAQRALADRTGTSADYASAAEYLNGQAASVRASGDTPQALALASESLALVEKASGTDSRFVAVAIANVVANLITLERYDEAEPLIARALDIRRKWYTADDPLIADTLIQLAGLKRHRAGFVGEPGPPNQSALLDEAADLAQQSLTLRHNVHKGDHESIAEALSLLGQIRMRQARYADALPALTAAMDMRTRLPRRNDGDLGRSESFLGECLRRAGRAPEAEPLLRAGLDKIKAAYGDKHRYTLEAIARLEPLNKQPEPAARTR